MIIRILNNLFLILQKRLLTFTRKILSSSSSSHHFLLIFNCVIWHSWSGSPPISKWWVSSYMLTTTFKNSSNLSTYFFSISRKCEPLGDLELLTFIIWGYHYQEIHPLHTDGTLWVRGIPMLHPLYEDYIKIYLHSIIHFQFHCIESLWLSTIEYSSTLSRIRSWILYCEMVNLLRTVLLFQPTSTFLNSTTYL